MAIIATAILSQGMSKAFAQSVQEDYDINPPNGCPYGEKVYAMMTSGNGVVFAFVSGINEETEKLSYSDTAQAYCSGPLCNWLHISDYPQNAIHEAGPLNHWFFDHAFAWTFVDITTAWCSVSTAPHNKLEEIKDRNRDGSVIDDLDKHLKKRGSDPLPERVKKELMDKGK